MPIGWVTEAVTASNGGPPARRAGVPGRYSRRRPGGGGCLDAAPTRGRLSAQGRREGAGRRASVEWQCPPPAAVADSAAAVEAALLSASMALAG